MQLELGENDTDHCQLWGPYDCIKIIKYQQGLGCFGKARGVASPPKDIFAPHGSTHLHMWVVGKC